VEDRLFSTVVALQYNIPLPPNIPLTIDNLPKIAKELDFPKIASNVRENVLEVFATDESASVQATLYLTLQTMLRSCPDIDEASMQLPNKHYM
jgi:urate oxidase